MLATPGALPDGPEWLFEVKWDGMRLLADVAAGRVRLTSRSERDVTANFPELAALTELVPDVLLDGEVVLLENGVPSFAALADRMHGPVAPRVAQARPVTFMVFDVLRLYGVPLLDRPFEERRGTLERLDLASVPVLSLSPTYTDGRALLAATRQRGMEGVVAKRRDAVYRPGRRSPGWRKITHRLSQACLVGGWRPERGSANRIGALLLGVPDGGRLRYAGRVGSGLAGELVQRALRDRLVETAAPPFAGPLPRAEVAGARWCEPLTVVEVGHSGWTEGGRLRQPVFRGLRDDLDPAHVELES
jgi:bifunctional non-homologous end joining protein LigD